MVGKMSMIEHILDSLASVAIAVYNLLMASGGMGEIIAFPVSAFVMAVLIAGAIVAPIAMPALIIGIIADRMRATT